jgi:hypothetical protein
MYQDTRAQVHSVLDLYFCQGGINSTELYLWYTFSFVVGRRRRRLAVTICPSVDVEVSTQFIKRFSRMFFVSAKAIQCLNELFIVPL